MNKPPETGPRAEDLIIPLRGTTVSEVQAQAATDAPQPRPSIDRLTVKVQVYHEQAGEEPVQAESTFAGMLSTSHQSYQRRQTVGRDWTELDTGWVPKSEVGYVFIANRRPVYDTVQSSSDSEEDDQRIAYVRLGGTPESAGWVVQPGQVFLAQAGADNINVRSDVDNTILSVTVFPR